MSYQRTTGPLMANSHPGSYSGQDAYTDMLVTENRNVLFDAENRRVQRVETEQNACGKRLQVCDRFDYTGGRQSIDMVDTVVRRLTEKECERLQGFPDDWTSIGEWTDDKGKKRETTASARYKALGNSIATPFWYWLMKRISAQYERTATLGSLFDGISGFPYCWARVNGPENCLWSSEIEPFCVAVAKRHFGDEETGEKGDYYEAIQKVFVPGKETDATGYRPDRTGQEDVQEPEAFC